MRMAQLVAKEMTRFNDILGWMCPVGKQKSLVLWRETDCINRLLHCPGSIL